MTTYEYYQHKKEYCEEMSALHADDTALMIFFRNAAAGFEIKKNKLTLNEAAK